MMVLVNMNVFWTWHFITLTVIDVLL